MNKNELKKYLDFRRITLILEKSLYVGFLCVQGLSTQDNRKLKKELDHIGYEYKVVKNTVICKVLAKLFVNFNSSLQGSIAICYLKNSDKYDTSENLLFFKLKDLFKVINKNSRVFFLGSYFYGSFYNTLFEHKVSSMSDLETTNMKSISLIQMNIINILRVISTPKNYLSSLLSNRKNS